MFDIIQQQLISKYFLFKCTVHFARIHNKYSHSYSLSWRRPEVVKYKKVATGVYLTKSAHINWFCLPHISKQKDGERSHRLPFSSLLSLRVSCL